MLRERSQRSIAQKGLARPSRGRPRTDAGGLECASGSQIAQGSGTCKASRPIRHSRSGRAPQHNSARRAGLGRERQPAPRWLKTQRSRSARPHPRRRRARGSPRLIHRTHVTGAPVGARRRSRGLPRDPRAPRSERGRRPRERPGDTVRCFIRGRPRASYAGPRPYSSKQLARQCERGSTQQENLLGGDAGVQRTAPRSSLRKFPPTIGPTETSIRTSRCRAGTAPLPPSTLLAVE
jgi:hypothetical protein